MDSLCFKISSIILGFLLDETKAILQIPLIFDKYLIKTPFVWNIPALLKQHAQKFELIYVFFRTFQGNKDNICE